MAFVNSIRLLCPGKRYSRTREPKTNDFWTVSPSEREDLRTCFGKTKSGYDSQTLPGTLCEIHNIELLLQLFVPYFYHAVGNLAENCLYTIRIGGGAPAPCAPSRRLSSSTVDITFTISPTANFTDLRAAIIGLGVS